MPFAMVHTSDEYADPRLYGAAACDHLIRAEAATLHRTDMTMPTASPFSRVETRPTTGRRGLGSVPRRLRQTAEVDQTEDELPAIWPSSDASELDSGRTRILFHPLEMRGGEVGAELSARGCVDLYS
jgi:hypothetical protein